MAARCRHIIVHNGPAALLMITYEASGLLQGIDVFDPKFNIVSPGADQDLYFPR